MKGQKSLYYLILILLTLSIINLSCKKDTSDTSGTSDQVVKPLRAIIQMSMGKVTASKGDNTIDIKRGMDITDTDYIQTFNGSRCVILFTTGSTLSLQENTKISVKVLMPKGVKAEMAQGSILMNVKKLTSDDSFSVSTPTAVAGVRGTRFLVNYDPKTSSTRVAVANGKVTVGPKITVPVEEQSRQKIWSSVAVDVNQSQSVTLNQNQNDRVNSTIKNETDSIQKNLNENKDISSINSIQSARSIVAQDRSQATVNEINTLQKMTDVVENTGQANQVLVVIAQEESKITVNEKTFNSVYHAYHEPNSKIKVKVEKEGFNTFETEYTIPQSGSFSPALQLSKKQADQTTTQPIKRKVMKKRELPRISAKLNIGTEAISPLFTADKKVMFVGKNGNFIIADMSDNGRIIANVPINSEIDSTPVLYNGIVYFGAKNSVLYAINARNGAVIFNKPLEGPLAFKNSVTGFQNFIYVATGGAVVYKLNRLNGQEIWKTNIGENVWASVAVDNDRVYVADESGVLRALKNSDGTEIWKQKVGLRVSMGSVFVRGTRVFINNEAGEIKVFNSNNGEAVNVNIQIGRLAQAPYLHGTFAYYPRANNVLVVSLDALRIIGTINSSGSSYFGVQGNNVYASVSDNEIKEMDLIGRATWGVQLDSKISHNPAADDLYVYAITSSGTLYKINKRDHEMIEVEVQE